VNAVAVRPIAPDDLELVCEALTARPPERHRQRAELQERGGFSYLIAWVAGRPVGFVGVGLQDDASPDVLAEARGYATVSDLHVEEEYRRRGVGRALMEELEREAWVAGMAGVMLDTGTGDEFAAARELYRSMGYIDRGGVYLGGWSDPHRQGVHFVDPLTLWTKPAPAR